MQVAHNGSSGKRAALIRFGAFFCVALLSLVIALLPYAIRGKYLALADDAVTQHATFLQYMFRNGIFGGAGGYDYAIGLGADYMTSFSYYMMFDPVNLLLYILPRDNFLFSYSVLVAVKFLLTAVFMYIYLRAHKVNFVLAVAFSVAYMLGGYMLFTYVRHPDLCAGAVYLPLVILGIEHAVDKKEPFLLVTAVFVTAISSFYMLFTVTLFAVAYAVLYYVYGVKNRGEKVTPRGFTAAFCRTAGFYALGLALASFLLLPVAYGYVNGSRSAGKGILFFDGLDLLSVAASFVLPVPGFHYTPIMLNAAVLLVCFAAFAVTRRSAMKTLAAVLALSTFIPFAGYALNLFNYVNNRHVYLLIFCVYALAAAHLNERRYSPCAKSANAMIKFGAAFGLLILNFAAWTAAELFFGNAHVALKCVALVCEIAMLCASGYIAHKIFARNFFSVKCVRRLNCRKLSYACFACVLCFAFALNVVYSAQFDNGDYFESMTSPAESYVAAQTAQSNEFFRLDKAVSGGWEECNNRSLNNGYRGTAIYNTMAPGEISDFLYANSLLSYTPSLGMTGLNGRTALQALLGVRYYYAEKGEYVPAGFYAVDGVSDLYETDEYVRFGTVFDKVMSESDFYALPAAERQYAMLGAVVRADSAVRTDSQESDYEHAAVLKEVRAERDFTLAAGETRSINVKTDGDCELYVEFSLSEVYERESFSVSCGKTEISKFICGRGDQMYYEQDGFLFKLDERGETVTFSNDGAEPLTFGNVRFTVAERRRVSELVASAAAKAHLTETRFYPSGFSGKISSDGGAMLLPVCYSRGWRAYVGGEQTAVYASNAGLMSIDIPAGEYEVRFEYRTPCLGLGTAVSAGAGVVIICAFAAYIILKKKSRA